MQGLGKRKRRREKRKMRGKGDNFSDRECRDWERERGEEKNEGKRGEFYRYGIQGLGKRKRRREKRKMRK